MHEQFGMIFRRWPEKYPKHPEIPRRMKKYYPNVTCVADCFEIRIQKPQNSDAWRRCYSAYKRSITIKALVAIESNGNVCFATYIPGFHIRRWNSQALWFSAKTQTPQRGISGWRISADWTGTGNKQKPDCTNDCVAKPWYDFRRTEADLQNCPSFVFTCRCHREDEKLARTRLTRFDRYIREKRYERLRLSQICTSFCPVAFLATRKMSAVWWKLKVHCTCSMFTIHWETSQASEGSDGILEHISKGYKWTVSMQSDMETELHFMDSSSYALWTWVSVRLIFDQSGRKYFGTCCR